VDENEFRSTYHSINETRCVFEKGLNARRCECRRARHFLLAGREGYRCTERLRQERCTRYLDALRHQARFTLGVPDPQGPLPHNKEIRAQIGGLEGVRRLLSASDGAERAFDVDALLSEAEQVFGSVEAIPFDALLPDVAAFQGRRRSGRR